MANFSRIDRGECAEKAIPEGVTLNSSNTLILQSVLNAIKEHGRSSMNKEVCGVLIGSLCWDKRPYLLIDACIEGKFADHHSGSVTFTSDTWDYIHSELAEKYHDRKIVGWYHTHPGFGIFLSNMDFFIHEHFFGMEWQPAYVFDPQAEKDGFFFWNGDKLEQEKVSVIPDVHPIDKEPSLKTHEKISIVFPEENGMEKKRKKRILVLLLSLFLLLIVAVSGMIILAMYRSEGDSPEEGNSELVRQFQRIIKQKEKKLEEKDIIIIQLQKERDSLQENEHSLKERIQLLQNDCDAFAMRVEQLQRDCDGLKDAKHELSKRILKQNNLLAENQKKIQEKDRQLNAARIKIRQLEQQIELLQKEISSFSVERPSLIPPPEPTVSEPELVLTPPEEAGEMSWYDYLFPWNWF